MVFGQLVMPVQCCAGARRRAADALDSRWVLGFTMGSWVHDKVHVKSLDFFEPCAKAAKAKDFSKQKNMEVQVCNVYDVRFLTMYGSI